MQNNWQVNILNRLTLLNNNHPNRYNPNYSLKSFNHFGIWMESKTSWLSSDEWDLSPKINQATQLAVLVAYHKEWGIQLTVLQESSPKESGSFITVILKNQTELKREMKFIYHRQIVGMDDHSISFISPSEHTIIQHGEHLVSLVSSSFHKEKGRMIAVGRKEKIWIEKEGKLALFPLCREGRESMIVTKLSLEPHQETYGRIWEVYGQSLEEIYTLYDKQQLYNQVKRAAERML
jgi:hypothetical protein